MWMLQKLKKNINSKYVMKELSDEDKKNAELKNAELLKRVKEYEATIKA